MTLRRAASFLHRLDQRLLPHSLLWRSFLLISLLLAASVTSWITIFDLFERVPRARQTAQMVVSVVNLTRTALINADPLLRLALLRDLSDQEGLRVYPAEASDVIEPLPDSESSRAVEAEVRRQLGPHARLAGKREGMEGLWISFQIDPDDPQDLFWVMLPNERFARVRTLEWLGWTVAAMILALVGAYLVVRNMAQPLRALARAARQIGRSEAPERLPERGAPELAEVNRAFNQMSDDLIQLESDRALILAGVSHDLRTPLARLRLGIEMSGAPPGDIDAMAIDIEEMDRIINQFLDFARGSTDEPQESTELAAMLAEIADSYIRRGLPVALDATLPSVPLRVRSKALRRAVCNLIDNAFRYAGNAPAVELGLTGMSGSWAIEVRDRGPGIPAAEAERLKRPFTRLESARTDTKGSGLGLAIVDRIARIEGGALDLLPRPDGGLLARIRLPRRESATRPV